jgi:hypothetical protein
VAPRFLLQNGRAKIHALLIIGESHAQSTDEIKLGTDEGIRPGHGTVAFSGVADGGIAGAGNDCPLLAGDAM